MTAHSACRLQGYCEAVNDAGEEVYISPLEAAGIGIALDDKHVTKAMLREWCRLLLRCHATTFQALCAVQKEATDE